MRLRTSAPLTYDAYRRNRSTGGFIIIDEATNETLGAGMLLDPDEPVTDEEAHAIQAAQSTVGQRRLGAEHDHPPAALRGARPPRRDGVDDRPALLGQVDDRRRAGGHAGPARASPPTASTATTCATASTATSASAPRTAPRTCAAPPRPPSCWPTRARSRSSRSSRPYEADRAQARTTHAERRPALPGGLRRHAAGGMRAPRPQGPVRQGPRRRDQRVHRRRRPLRGARPRPT